MIQGLAQARTLNRNLSTAVHKLHGNIVSYKEGGAVPAIGPNSAPFKITLIDSTTNACAICSSRQLEGGDGVPRKQCPGCSLPNDEIPIRFRFALTTA